MKWVEGYLDMGAPEYAVTGLAAVKRISAGQVRATYYSRRDEGNIVPVHTVWDYQTYLATWARSQDVFAALQQEWPGMMEDMKRLRLGRN